jgi:hypothetical protein
MEVHVEHGIADDRDPKPARGLEEPDEPVAAEEWHHEAGKVRVPQRPEQTQSPAWELNRAEDTGTGGRGPGFYQWDVG